MPTYRYRGPHGPELHEVVAESYERDSTRDRDVAFINPTSFDGKPYPRNAASLCVIVAGDIEIISHA